MEETKYYIRRENKVGNPPLVQWFSSPPWLWIEDIKKATAYDYLYSAAYDCGMQNSECVKTGYHPPQVVKCKLVLSFEPVNLYLKNET